MNKALHHSITCIFLIIVFFAGAYKLQSQNIGRFELPHYGQLPNRQIKKIFQDSEGLIWYCTEDGLCRDDGYNIQIFRSDFKTPDVIKHNYITCITEDLSGKIWFGTLRGAYILDKTNGKVIPLDSQTLQRSFIYFMQKTSDGYMWIATGNKLIKYDTSGKRIKTYLLYDIKGKPSWMAGFCESRQKQILITIGKGGIYCYDKKLDTFKQYAEPPVSRDLTTILQDRTHNYFWVGTQSKGVLLFNPSAPKDSIYTYSPLPVNPMGEKEGNILYLAQDEHKGTLWMTTRSSLIAMRYDETCRQLRQTDFRQAMEAC